MVGSPARAAQLGNWLRQKSEIGLHTAGLISQETFEQAGDLPILGQFGDFDRIVRECGATQVILLEFPRTNSDRVIIDACDRLGVRLIILSDLEETLRHPVVHFEDGFRFMALREEPLENPLNRFVKARDRSRRFRVRPGPGVSSGGDHHLDHAAVAIARPALP